MVDEATTPTPKEGEATASKEKEAITSEKPKEEPTSSPEEKKVAELEGKVDVLKKELEKQKNLQSQADKKARIERITRERLEQRIEKIRSGEIGIDEELPPESTPKEVEEEMVARLAISNLVWDNPEYQEVLKKDVTLKEVLRKNPLALVENAIDAEDTVEQVKDMLDKRVSSLKKETQPKEKPKEGEGKEFRADVVQPSGAESPKTETFSEKALKEGGVDAVEKSIRSKIRLVG
ncbi:MAG: hypothetical protein LRZ94_00815 [Candidatus Pacebacteria bacterium]|nr:hypothetical protein [Candidatus Paceibacterota bacterium]